MISLGIMTVTQLSLNFTEVIEEFPIVVRRRIFDEIKVIEKRFAKEKLCGEIQMKTDRFISPEQAVMFLTKAAGCEYTYEDGLSFKDFASCEVIFYNIEKIPLGCSFSIQKTIPMKNTEDAYVLICKLTPYA